MLILELINSTGRPAGAHRQHQWQPRSSGGTDQGGEGDERKAGRVGEREYIKKTRTEVAIEVML